MLSPEYLMNLRNQHENENEWTSKRMENEVKWQWERECFVDQFVQIIFGNKFDRVFIEFSDSEENFFKL